MGDEFNPQPRETFDEEINQIAEFAQVFVAILSALIQRTEFGLMGKKEQKELEAQIDFEFKKYEKKLMSWTKKNIEFGYLKGVIRTLMTTGEVKTQKKAKSLIDLKNQLHQATINQLIQSTYNDLLLMTNNTKQRVKDIVRRIVYEVMKDKEIGNSARGFRKEIIKQLKQQAVQEIDFAIVDRVGRTWTIEAYSKMVARTKISQAQIAGIENESILNKIDYGVVSRHGTTCKICSPWEGRVVKLNPEAPGDFPILSEIRSVPGKKSLFHPSCKHHIDPFSNLDILPPTLKKLNKLD